MIPSETVTGQEWRPDESAVLRRLLREAQDHIADLLAVERGSMKAERVRWYARKWLRDTPQVPR